MEAPLSSMEDQDASGFPALRQLRFDEDPTAGDKESIQRVHLLMDETNT